MLYFIFDSRLALLRTKVKNLGFLAELGCGWDSYVMQLMQVRTIDWSYCCNKRAIFLSLQFFPATSTETPASSASVVTYRYIVEIEKSRAEIQWGYTVYLPRKITREGKNIVRGVGKAPRHSHRSDPWISITLSSPQHPRNADIPHVFPCFGFLSLQLSFRYSWTLCQRSAGFIGDFLWLVVKCDRDVNPCGGSN